ncbi:MBL fold metallo-hydrolase [Rhodobacterales bacterium HKCCE2091]|nr:MBL fold metallo-hydrolase [Rhodobacterales bacterium HKCCE2091]
MPQTRRSFLVTAAAAGSVTFLPYRLRAEAHGGADSFETPDGPVTVHPIRHASVVLETPMGTIYADPVGDPSLYEGLPPADLILITHEHGDHFNADTLSALMGEGTHLVTNEAVAGMLPEGMTAEAMANGDETEWNGVAISAIPAHNLTEGRMQFHPEGRDNGYVLDLGGFRIYLSGDTEDVPEMRALENIDLAFVCMVLPYTMDAEQAASAVQEFAPTYVYPYHYMADQGGQDPEAFAEMVGDASEVKFGPWYG